MIHRTLGLGRCTGHFGEILQGSFSVPGRHGSVRALVTLPCPQVGALAKYSIEPSPLTVAPATKKKCLRAAELVLAHFGLPPRGRLEIESGIEEGLGMGSSASDIVATVRAVALALGKALAPNVEAQLVRLTEGSADPLMFTDRLMLYAHRDGRSLEGFAGPCPRFLVVGFDTEPGLTVDTATFCAPEYTDDEIRRFDGLRDLLRRSMRVGDLAGIAQVATSSAQMNQPYLPKRHFAEMVEVGFQIGALGVVAAHTGPVAGWILHPAAHDRAAACEVAALDLGFRPIAQFLVGCKRAA